MALADAREPIVINDPPQIYSALSEATGLQDKLLRLNLSYGAALEVIELFISFTENNDDPEYTFCSVKYEAIKIGNFSQEIALVPSNPSVTIDKDLPFDLVEVPSAQGPWE